MKICVVQTRPVKGDIEKNIYKHLQLVELALTHGADTIIFPELSITGYEPELAATLRTNPDDSRFADFQRISSTNQVNIGVGVPLKNNADTSIGVVHFKPNQPRQTYFKTYLHADEEPFFVSGQNASVLIGSQPNVALAICYELSVADHAENACKNQAQIYVASVAKSVSGLNKTFERLAEIAKQYSMTVLMANCVGPAGGMECGGKSSVWNSQGKLMGQLDDTSEGVLIFDTETKAIIQEK